MWNLFRQPALQKERRDPVSQQPLPFIPTAGSLSPRLPPTWLGALGWRKTHRNEERTAQGNVLIPVPHFPHAASRALRLHHQTSLVPACTTEQPLTPSLPENRLILPKKPGQRTPPAAPSRGGSDGPGSRAVLVDFQPQTQRDAGFWGGRGRFGSLSL